MKKFDSSSVRDAFIDSVEAARLLVIGGEATFDPDGRSADISRETRGLAYVLLYGAYEKLLKALSRELLETAASHSGYFRELKPQFGIAGMHSHLQSIGDSTNRKKVLDEEARKLFSKIASEKPDCIQCSFFPDDGSHMKYKQVQFFCRYFGLPDPNEIFKNDSNLINQIVLNRNAIAHGEQSADEVGRTLSYGESIDLIERWKDCWLRFLKAVDDVAEFDEFYLC